MLPFDAPTGYMCTVAGSEPVYAIPMHCCVVCPGAWSVTLNSAVPRPLASLMTTVPAAKLLPLFVVVPVNAEYVPNAATLPSTPTMQQREENLPLLVAHSAFPFACYD